MSLLILISKAKAQRTAWESAFVPGRSLVLSEAKLGLLTLKVYLVSQYLISGSKDSMCKPMFPLRGHKYSPLTALAAYDEFPR